MSTLQFPFFGCPISIGRRSGQRLSESTRDKLRDLGILIARIQWHKLSGSRRNLGKTCRKLHISAGTFCLEGPQPFECYFRVGRARCRGVCSWCGQTSTRSRWCTRVRSNSSATELLPSAMAFEKAEKHVSIRANHRRWGHAKRYRLLAASSGPATAH